MLPATSSSGYLSARSSAYLSAQGEPSGDEESLENEGERRLRQHPSTQPEELYSAHASAIDDVADTKLLSNIEPYVPKYKVETMGLGILYFMIILMWVLGTLILVLEIVIIGSVSNTKTDPLGNYSTLFQAMYALEGITRTIGITVLLGLFFAYPQRVIRSAKQRTGSYWPSRHQRLLVFLIVLLIFVPPLNIYEVATFWQAFEMRLSALEGTHGLNGTSAVSIGVLSLLLPFEPAALGYTIVITSISLVVIYYVFGTFYHLHGNNAVKVVQNGPRQSSAASETVSDSVDEAIFVLKGVRKGDTDNNGIDNEAEIDDDDEGNAVTQSSWFANQIRTLHGRILARHTFLSRIRTYRIAAWKRYEKLTFGSPVSMQLCLLLYLVLLLGFSMGLRTSLSMVPFASAISALRVCTFNTSELAAQTITAYRDVVISGVRVENATIVLMIDSTVSPEHSPCSPLQKDLTAFRRACGAGLFFVCELGIFILLYRQQRDARRLLHETPYASARKEILGYQFFLNISKVCWAIIIIGGFLAAWINPIEMYLVEKGSIHQDSSNAVFGVNLTVNPLFQMGVGVGTTGFGPYLLMLMLWLTYTAFAYLPVDSIGLKGWFTGCEIQGAKERLIAELRQDEYLVLVPREKDVAHLLAIRDRERKFRALMSGLNANARQRHDSNERGDHLDDALRLMQFPRIRALAENTQNLHDIFRREELKTFKLSGLRWAQSSGNMSALAMQVASNVLVLETEILNFHFMHLSYMMVSRKDSVTGQRVPLTFDEKKALVEDPRFNLVAHVDDATTDTHVMVFSGADRVVVAFRGSVSLTNWQTDFDSSEVVCEYAQDVEPDLSGAPPGALSYAKRVAAMPPKVHGGFVKAYESIRQELAEIVRNEMFGEGNSEQPQKVLFVTGHSLGAGLAILCALDLGVRFKLGRGWLALTTWGSPKIGTYSFVCRFNRVCPSAKRFCMADDPITKLPVEVFLQKFRLKGWWHCGTEILMNDLGNMLIRPSPVERFMFQKVPLGTPTAHLRMTYATAIMLWVTRSHSDFEADWWPGVITLFHKKAARRLGRVPRNLRERLLDSLRRPGVVYRAGNRDVRDIDADTLIATTNDSEADGEALVTALLVALRMRQRETFKHALQELIQSEARYFAAAPAEGGEVHAAEEQSLMLQQVDESDDDDSFNV